MEIIPVAPIYGSKKVISDNLKPAKTSQASDAVDLSSTSTSLQIVHDKINSLPEVRIPIVESIKKRIQYNDYPRENHLLSALDKLIADKIV